MGFRLPPLNTLRLFEAAGRQLSFKNAAEELHVTPSAVSHGIQVLEEWLNCKLFHRTPRGLELTAAGKAYLPVVRKTLSDLSQATRDLPGHKATGTLSVSAAPTFASRWLIPRLPRFIEQYASIAVTIDTTHSHVDLPFGDIDFAIRMAQSPGSSGTWVPLIREAYVPVCAPSLAATLGDGSTSEQLSRAPLIHVTTVTEEWSLWFESMGVAPVTATRIFRFDTIQMAMEAAVKGLGIALGRKPLVDDDVHAGRLVELFQPPVQGNTRYWLVGNESTFSRPEGKLFRRWLVDESDGSLPAE
jgi:LysR family transcriptional regulator, glycine cleavage system transcriptional activator